MQFDNPLREAFWSAATSVSSLMSTIPTGLNTLRLSKH